MTITQIASAVFLGNVMTGSVLWAAIQFHRHDYRASWWAYVAFLLPLAVAAADLWLSGERPPFLAALAVPR